MKAVPRSRRSTCVSTGWPARGISRCVGVALLSLVMLAQHGLASAQPIAQRLLQSAPDADNARYSLKARPATPGVVRQKPVQLDTQRFVDQQKAAAADLAVDLFDGASVTLTPDRLERRAEGNYTWHGNVRGHPGGFALITVVGGRVSGMIDLGDGARGSRFQLQSTADGLTLLQQLDGAAFPEDHPGAAELLAPTLTGPRAETSELKSKGGLADAMVAKADTSATIDVMIVYSNQTATAAGAGIDAQAQQAVDAANLAYANSGITTRLRLVYVGPANYDESGDFTADLNRLTSSADGYMDNVATLRDTYGADLVSLFVENGQYCGLGWIGPSANYAFTVVNRGCASSNLSFPHEIGHNFGARHDTYVDAGTSPYAYGHGWVDVGQRWRDVMAYNNACAAYGVNCTRIPYFSNPNMTYTGDVLGSTSTADTVRVHNQNALTVANFRASRQGGATSCSYALAPSSASVGSAAGSGAIGVTTQSGCAWNAASSATWLTTGSTAAGSGTLAYAFAANNGPARSGSISIGGVAFNVSQASGCTYTLSTTSASVPAGVASGTTSLTTTQGCTWTASSSAAWLTTTTTGGSGGATISYAVAANGGAARSANLTIGGSTFVVSQAAATVQTPAATAAVASLSTTSLDLGTVTLGKTSGVKGVVLTNTGGAALSLSALTLGGANASEFTQKGSCAVGATLAAGGSCTLSITFTPAAVGTRTATLGVITSANAATLNLSGTGKKAGRK